MISNDTVLVDFGPMTMTIFAQKDGNPLIDMAFASGKKAITILDQLAKNKEIIKKLSKDLEESEEYGDVINRMIIAAQRVDKDELTPLAAVAGAVADEVADFLVDSGAEKIIVNNGGDIALRLKPKEKVVVGVMSPKRDISYKLTILGNMGIGGVCTSGYTGRSFSLGIADLCVAIAKNASLADAAATIIGNETNIDSPHIKRERAEMIYPDTDIPAKYVTREVGDLTEKEKREAIKRGLKKAYELISKGIIIGSLISVKDITEYTPFVEDLITQG